MPRYDYGDDGGYSDQSGRGHHHDDRQPRYQEPYQRGDYRDRDGRQQPVGYQPTYGYQQQTPPPAPAKKRRWPLWAALAVVGIILVSCVAAVASSGGGGTGTAGASATSTAAKGGTQAQGLFQHPEDVTISSCGTDDLGMMTAQVLVHNTSGKASNYSIQIAFQSVDGAQKYGDGYAIINTLAAGQQQPEQAQSFKQPPGQFKCVVISAQRTQAI
ncbi:hypothetical protein [Pseudofrankia inefficax]|uniref:DUF4352 domain-containing protein n=1 Tax=Pseudofrankia inefficax (strain DSM 45817 / CECT 9037 / DDB 130130 / EuI1c) TaxID=298654 RepID=E3J6Z8_PSEI1|nr:hypothetical protein [Pseudofrankia inefficax]ADP83218.1 hypothetical protein FraEuI1c_5230 [Pseudofrankia inefficax]